MLQEDDLAVDDAPEDEGPGAPRQSYNFAPGYHGIVYRADVPDWGAGPARERGGGGGSSGRGKETGTTATTTGSNELGDDSAAESAAAPTGASSQTAGEETEAARQHDPKRYILQSMKWGLVPFWTKRDPGYGGLIKTINCRDDSLAQRGGMWSSMKARKRCVAVAQGFYEWLRVGPKEKVPHFVKRADGRLMCFAGLWDCVRYDDEGDGDGEGGGGGGHQPLYTYTVITTDSNKQLRFLHDRMPVILDPGSKEMAVWLDPGRHEWSGELQAVLKPYQGELEVYPVSKEVGKVGNNSPSFVIPVASRENKSNIANFFAKGNKKKDERGEPEGEPEVEVEKEEGAKVKKELESVDEAVKEADEEGVKIEAEGEPGKGRKREASPPLKGEEPPAKKGAAARSPAKKDASPVKKPQGSGKISATTNVGKSPAKGKGGAKVKAEEGSQKITKFFANSA